MKNKYILIDMSAISKYDLISKENDGVQQFLEDSSLPEEYKKIIICINKRFNAGQEYVLLGNAHNNKFFELITNHPFNWMFGISEKNRSLVLHSATFGYYVQLNQKDGRFKAFNEQDVIKFYESLIKNNLFEEYIRVIYSIFTNAYEKTRPRISKQLLKYRTDIK